MTTIERERGGLRRVLDWRVAQADLQAILGARHGDPFGVLGPHRTDAGPAVRAFVPNAESLAVIGPDDRLFVNLTRKHAHGFFEGLVPDLQPGTLYKLRAQNAGGVWELYDPYAFPPVLGALDHPIELSIINVVDNTPCAAHDDRSQTKEQHQA